MVRHSEERNTRFFESSGGAGRGHCGGGVPFGFSHAETGVERPDRRIGVTAAWGMISFLGGLLAGMGRKRKNFCGERPAAACMFWFFSSSPWQEGGGTAPAAGPAGPLPGCLRGAGMAGGMCAGIR